MDGEHLQDKSEVWKRAEIGDINWEASGSQVVFKSMGPGDPGSECRKALPNWWVKYWKECILIIDNKYQGPCTVFYLPFILRIQLSTAQPINPGPLLDPRYPFIFSPSLSLLCLWTLECKDLSQLGQTEAGRNPIWASTPNPYLLHLLCQYPALWEY